MLPLIFRQLYSGELHAGLTNRTLRLRAVGFSLMLAGQAFSMLRQRPAHWFSWLLLGLAAGCWVCMFGVTTLMWRDYLTRRGRNPGPDWRPADEEARIEAVPAGRAAK